MSEDKLSDELLASLDNPGDDGKVGAKVPVTGVGSETITVMNPALAAALSEEAGGDSAAEQQLTAEQQARVDEIMEALKDVMDPELGINIVDLGLLYGLHLDGDDLLLDMTLTSAGCPLTDLIDQQCRFVLNDLVDAVSINWVWLPPWGPDKITDDGREQLRALGFNV